jgi:hypothetical protein
MANYPTESRSIRLDDRDTAPERDLYLSLRWRKPRTETYHSDSDNKKTVQG